jgi:DNA polymerase-3 subunit delta'
MLHRARAAGRLPHALLIAGPAGVGKRLLTDLLVRGLLCRDPRPDSLPCGRCQDCHLVHLGNHPDLVRVGPDPQGKSDEIKVGVIRDLVESEGLTATRGSHKVVSIDPAERMNPSAANALLKTLEEPTPGTLFCLITERAHLLPATVRSRCQRLNLVLPDEAQAMEWLAGRVDGVDPRLLLRLAHGASRAARPTGPVGARRDPGFPVRGRGGDATQGEAQPDDLGPRVS